MSGQKPIKNKKYTLNKKMIYLTSMCYMLYSLKCKKFYEFVKNNTYYVKS